MPKKRGRKPKRKAEEPEIDVAPPKKRGRQAKVAETLTPSQRQTMQRILDSVHDSLNDLEEKSNTPGTPNRGIIDPFIELPPKADYPNYYQLITKPICMNQIQKKINSKQYQTLKEFRNDIGLLCSNCRQYNEDASLLFQDANLIEVCITNGGRKPSRLHDTRTRVTANLSKSQRAPSSRIGRTPNPTQTALRPDRSLQPERHSQGRV